MQSTPNSEGTPSVSGLRGCRTWRLALLFFPGIGGALALLDALVVRTRGSATDCETIAAAGGRVLALPAAHALVFCYTAYAPLIDQWVKAMLPQMQKSPRSMMVTICCLVYIVAAIISL